MTWAWRQKVAMFARIHGISDFSGLSLAFGPRWAWWFRDVIESLNILDVPELGSDRSAAVTAGIDFDRFAVAIENPSFLAGNRIHLYCPKRPLTDNGSEFPAPRELAPFFDFHANNWFRSEQQIKEIRESMRNPTTQQTGGKPGRHYTLK
jgi:hypothetical protein